VDVFISNEALEAIFDECDQFEADETGGRIIGLYRNKGKKHEIEVQGIIGPGPEAKRSATSFFQDGDYQEKIFRSVEGQHPEVEHLGNWHTHHVNGLSTLSSGDRATYQRIVNHEKHNIDFFYAILVVEKVHRGRQRYKVKHYFLRRNDPEIYDVPPEHVHIVDKSIIWPARPREDSSSSAHCAPGIESQPNRERVKDQDFFAEFNQSFKPLFSKSMGAFYWKGELDLIDGTSAEVIVMERQENGEAAYSIAVPGEKSSTYDALKDYDDRFFKSARRAVLDLEKALNKEIYSKREINS